jgi:macrolide transport system ATP-binding/permease protein
VRIFRRLLYLLRHGRQAADLAEEMDFHRQMLEQEGRQAGLPAEEARYAALQRMGGAALAQEDARSVWLAWSESVVQDLRYAVRALVKEPAFTTLALLTLTLGIGLNTSLFTVFNAIALRPWPVRDPARVVSLLRDGAGPHRSGYAGFSAVEFRYLRDHSRTLNGAILTRAQDVSLDQQPDGPRTTCHFVSGNYFDVLGVEMTLGRGFASDEDRMEAPQAVAVVSHGTWQTRYGGDPHMVGRRVRIDDVPFTVVGVAGEEFTGISSQRHDLWVPQAARPLARPSDSSAKLWLTDPRYCCSNMAGRLAPGIRREQAQVELTTLANQFQAELRDKPHQVVVSGTTFFGQPDAKRQALPAMALLIAACASILLLACANVGNLLLARAAARQREIAVRLSLGAGRSRVVRQLLTESLLLAAMASGLGLSLAYVLPGFVLRNLGQDAPSFKLTPDSAVLAYAVGIAVLSAVAFGLAPALRGTRLSLSEVMKQQSAQTSARFPLRGALLGVQVAISVVLLVGAGLLVHGLERSRSHDPGFTIAGVTLLSVDLPVNRYDFTRGRAFWADLTERLQPLAGSSAVGLSFFRPLSRGRNMTTFRLSGQNNATPVLAQFVNAGYFETLGIPIVAGRNFTPADAGRSVNIINEAMARRYWPGQNAVGQTIILGGLGEAKRWEVVGVVRNAEVTGLGPVEPILFSQFSGEGQASVLLRAGAVAPDWPRRLAAVVKQVEPRAAASVLPMSEQLDLWLGPARASATLAASLGLLALVLAAVGVYGVIAYSVEQRRREIGVRMALGAAPYQIVRFIVRANARAVLCGLAVGLAASLAVSRLLQSSLNGVSPLDPLAYGAVLALLLLAGVAASAIPARRAARIDPLVALHYE